MSVTIRGNKPSAADSPLWGGSSANISKPTTPLIDAGYALQASPGSANWNWITNYLSAAATHVMIYGVAQWDTNETYVADSYTNRNGIQFKSRAAGNQGNIPESTPDKWHDTRTPLAVAISAGGTHTPQSLFNEVLNIDTSGGDFALTIDPGLFSNQLVKVVASGGNTVTLTISGHTGTVTLTDQTLIMIWNGSGYFIEQSTVSLKKVSASGPVVFGPVSYEIELDVSLGNVDIDPLPLSDFIGQTVHFYAVGSGIGSIGGGNGVYVNGVYITENTGGAVCRGVSGGLWKLDNGVTADWVSAETRINQYSYGYMILDYNASLDVTTTTATGSLFRSTTALVYAIPFEATTFKIKVSNTRGSDVGGWAGNVAFSPIDKTGFTFIGMGVTNTTRVKPSYIARGDY
jgi:hypothetical protein